MSHSILVVEDDLSSRELMADWLQTEGYLAVTCGDLASAQAALKRQPPALVLLDVKLAGESGLDLARWMRDDPQFARIPVIAVTAHAMITEREQIFQAGCSACVPKPVNFDDLRAQLLHWLAGHRPSPSSNARR